jgi:hypothetical protein
MDRKKIQTLGLFRELAASLLVSVTVFFFPPQGIVK